MSSHKIDPKRLAPLTLALRSFVASARDCLTEENYGLADSYLELAEASIAKIESLEDEDLFT